MARSKVSWEGMPPGNEPPYEIIPNILAPKHAIWASPHMRVKTHRMKSSFASRSFRGLTTIKKDKRFTTRLVLKIESQVPYTKFQDQGGTTPTGGHVTPAGFVQDGFNTWWRRDDAAEIRWK